MQDQKEESIKELEKYKTEFLTKMSQIKSMEDELEDKLRQAEENN